MRLNGTVSDADFEVVPTRIYLVESRFEDLEEEEVENWSPDGTVFSVGLGFGRPSLLNLIVYLNISAGVTESEEDENPPPFIASVTYAGEFSVVEQGLEPGDEIESILDYVGFDLAPRLLYTYVREHYTNLTSRWRGRTVYLPFLPIPLESEQTIPPPPPTSASQRELPLPMETAGGAEPNG